MTKDEFYNRQRVLLDNYRRAKQELITEYTQCRYRIGDTIGDNYVIYDIDVILYNSLPIAAYFARNAKGIRHTFLQHEIDNERP